MTTADTTALTINIPKGFSRWSALDHLKTEEDMQLYLNACFEEAVGDGRLINAALGDIAKARVLVCAGLPFCV